MKKIILLAFAAVMMLACEGPRGPQGPKGDGMNWEIEEFRIRTGDWVQLTNDDNPNELLYRATRVPDIIGKSDPELINFIYENGNVFGYIFVIQGQYENQTPLPYVINFRGENNESIVETFYFDFTEEDVAFYVSYSGNNLNYHPGERFFRIVMNW